MIPLLAVVGCVSMAKHGDLEVGVSQTLAKERAACIENLSYSIHLTIPSSPSQPINGRETVLFDMKSNARRVVIDFTGGASSVKSVKLDGKDAKYSVEAEHIVVHSRSFATKGNRIDIEFVAGDKALNRKDDLLYSLFVPDRARTVFPCFDQPDLKAHFNLELEVPTGWTAISNAKIIDSSAVDGGSTKIRFAKSEPISTYLFSFTAGKFFKAHKEIDGKVYNMIYRETDSKKVANNMDAIFKMVDYSVRWMERYTGVLYPFAKYDMALIPYFQFGGMEHPGSIYYLDSKMWLDENATMPEKLARAELIAHETAHIWFGDLVTMKWFNDVWMKEVFAGFFADKIVKELFPESNGDLNFLIAHAPGAYSEDRTLGSNPIRQNLDNLNLAGTMYGNIIYHKAPIVIRSLERLMGQHAFQNALREYLKVYSLGNADWNDLVKIFDKHAKFSVTSWSKSWIERSGMPVYSFSEKLNSTDSSIVTILQKTPKAADASYLQLVDFSRFEKDKGHSGEVLVGDGLKKGALVALKVTDKNNGCLIPNSNGFSYGYFELDSLRCAAIARCYPQVASPVVRASCLITLYENMLNGRYNGGAMVRTLCGALAKESNEQMVSLILSYLFSSQLYFTPASDVATKSLVEESLWKAYNRTDDRRLQIQYLRVLSKLMSSKESTTSMLSIWTAEVAKEKSWISNNDLQNFALELCVRLPESAPSIIAKMKKAIANPDNLRRFDFVSNAVNADRMARDKFFESLLHVENRKQEVWVADALRLLNHPLRAEESREYLAKGLLILPEIQQTGDIFFPKNWVASLLYGHASVDDYAIVSTYLNREGKSISTSLLSKVYQASDLLRRACHE